MLHEPATLEQLVLTTLAKTFLDPSSTSQILATPGAVPLLQHFVETPSSNKDKIAALILTRIALDPACTDDIGYPLQQLFKTFLPLLANPEFHEITKTTLISLAASQPGPLIDYLDYLDDLSTRQGLSLDFALFLAPLLLDLLNHAELGAKAAQLLSGCFYSFRDHFFEPIVKADGIAKLIAASASASFLVRTHAMLLLCDLFFLANAMDMKLDENKGSLWTTFAKPFADLPPFIKATKEIPLINFIAPLTALLSHRSFQADAARMLIDITHRIGSGAIPLMLNADVVTQLDDQLLNVSGASSNCHAYFICLLKNISQSRAGVSAIQNSGLMPKLQSVLRAVPQDDWMLREILTKTLEAVAPAKNPIAALLSWLAPPPGTASNHQAAPAPQAPL